MTVTAEEKINQERSVSEIDAMLKHHKSLLDDLRRRRREIQDMEWDVRQRLIRYQDMRAGLLKTGDNPF